MVRRDVVRVLLLLGEGAQEIFGSRQLLEWNHCQCHFAKSEREASERRKAGKFDIVLRRRPDVGPTNGTLVLRAAIIGDYDYLLDWRLSRMDRSEWRWERRESFRQRQ